MKILNEFKAELYPFIMKIARLKKLTELVILFMGMIKKNQLKIELTLKA